MRQQAPSASRCSLLLLAQVPHLSVYFALSQLEEQLQPNKFYRINRHLLVNIEAIKKVHTWLGGRLKLELLPATTAETVVSRERVNGFKDWLGQ